MVLKISDSTGDALTGKHTSKSEVNLNINSGQEDVSIILEPDTAEELVEFLIDSFPQIRTNLHLLK